MSQAEIMTAKIRPQREPQENKVKVTLTCDPSVVKKARKANINMSYVLEQTLDQMTKGHKTASSA